MKMILIITTIIAACLIASHTRANAHNINKEPFIIQTATTGNAVWMLHKSYQHMQVQYKGSKMDAYYENAESLVGFGKSLSALELPVEVSKKIAKKFHACCITNVMLFIDTKGHIYYYAGVMRENKLMAVKVSSKCRLNVLQKICLN